MSSWHMRLGGHRGEHGKDLRALMRAAMSYAASCEPTVQSASTTDMCSRTLLHWAKMGLSGSIANGSQVRQYLLLVRS
jgi:hypothetical protein